MSKITKAKYIDQLEQIATADVEELQNKDKAYGGSWQKRAGIGAFMMAARKWDRLEEQMKRVGYDVFLAINDTKGEPEGVIDDVRDLRRYLMLIEAEMIARGVVE